MGLVYRGLPLDLIQDIAEIHKPDLFVETGTFKGDSLAEARELFPECYSIEIADDFYQRACERFRDDDSIHLLLGNSAAKLREIDFSKSSSGVFWLDAHYSGGTTGGEGDCPLLTEVEFIARLEIDTYILIDDARHVLSPYQGERYCTIEALFEKLPKENYHVIINDIVISVPLKARKLIEEYCRKHTTANHRKIKSKRIRALLKGIVGDLS